MTFGLNSFNNNGYEQMSDYRANYTVEARVSQASGVGFAATGYPDSFFAYRNNSTSHVVTARFSGNLNCSLQVWDRVSKQNVSTTVSAIKIRVIKAIGPSAVTYGLRTYGPSGELLVDSGYPLVKFDGSFFISPYGSMVDPQPTIINLPPTTGTRYWVTEKLAPNGLIVPSGNFIDNNTFGAYVPSGSATGYAFVIFTVL